MHHKIGYYYSSAATSEEDERVSPLKYSTLAFTIFGESGEKIPGEVEQMCEAKMDPESAGSDIVESNKSTISNSSSCDGGGCGGGGGGIVHNHKSKGPLTPISQDDEMSSDDLISVGGSPSPSLTSPDTLSRTNADDCCSEDEYFRPLKKLRMLQVESPSHSNSASGVKSFSITDILSHKPGASPSPKSNHSSKESGRSIEVNNVVIQQRIVRPWDPQSKTNGRRNSSDSSPLDALFQMTSKTFEGLNGHHENSDMGQGRDHQMFSSRQPPKKKRKSRTAFTNHQIFELEKRFLYQKYLSPADRDDIAQQLGLTNAQVITWFQNRRAKLKRDMEELKKDVESAKLLSAHKSFLESAHDLGLLKKRPQSQMDMNAAAAASYHIASPGSSSQSSHSPINLTSESPPSTH